jgi:hypothetical protein
VRRRESDWGRVVRIVSPPWPVVGNGSPATPVDRRGPGTVVSGLRVHERYQNGQLFELLRFTNPPTKHSVPKNQNGIDKESLSARAQMPSTRPAAIRILNRPGILRGSVR